MEYQHTPITPAGTLDGPAPVTTRSLGHQVRQASCMGMGIDFWEALRCWKVGKMWEDEISSLKVFYIHILVTSMTWFPFPHWYQTLQNYTDDSSELVTFCIAHQEEVFLVSSILIWSTTILDNLQIFAWFHTQPVHKWVDTSIGYDWLWLGPSQLVVWSILPDIDLMKWWNRWHLAEGDMKDLENIWWTPMKPKPKFA